MTINQIVNRIYRLTNTNSGSYVAANMLDDINIALNRVYSLVITADGRWQMDDENSTDFPIATTDIIQGQTDYTIAISFLRIHQVELKPTNGIWRVIDPIDERDLAEQGTSPSYLQTIQAIPYMYDKIGNSVILYPTPNFSQSASLKVWFQRGPFEFTSGEVTTGTKQPGFNSLYHDLIPLWVAYSFFLINDQSMCQRIMDQIVRLEKALLLDYGTRDKDDKPRITTSIINYR